MSCTTTVCILLLGAMCLANAMPVQMQRDIEVLYKAVDAAKLLYDRLKAEQEAEARVPSMDSYQKQMEIQRDMKVLNIAMEAAKLLYDDRKTGQDAEAEAHYSTQRYFDGGYNGGGY